MKEIALEISMEGETNLTKAYVLVSTEIGSESETLNEIKRIPEVTEAYVVYGVYDLLVRIETLDTEVLKDNVIPRIRHLDKVRSTITMIEHPDEKFARAFPVI